MRKYQFEKVKIIDYPRTCMTFPHHRTVHYYDNPFYFFLSFALDDKVAPAYINIQTIAHVQLATKKST